MKAAVLISLLLLISLAGCERIVYKDRPIRISSGLLNPLPIPSEPVTYRDYINAYEQCVGLVQQCNSQLDGIRQEAQQNAEPSTR